MSLPPAVVQAPPADRPAHQSWIAPAGRWLTRRRPVLFAPFFAVVLLTARRDSSSRVEWIQDLSGLLCLCGGAWLRVLAVSYHESSQQNHPITAGPYAWVRHPLYLANLLLGLGVVLLSGWRPMLFVYLPVFGVVYWMIIRSEEAHLCETHGEEYASYLRSVPALIPWKAYRGARYGLRNDYKIKRGREWLKVAGYGLVAAGLILFKELRRFIPAPESLRLSFIPTWFLAAVVVLGVALRPKTCPSPLRSLQTAVVVLCALLIALRVPGAVPKPTM